MRALIAGGSGMIGRELTSTLSDGGDEVSILSRNPEKVTGMPVGVKLIQWDGRTVHNWGKEMENIDVVINLTGENLSGKWIFPSRWTNERKERLLSSRVNAGQVLSKAIEMSVHKPVVFIQASGIGFYGTLQDKPLTEEDAGGTDFMSKLGKQWEASSLSVEESGVRRVIIRNGMVLSKKSKVLLPLLLQYKLFAGGPIGNGRQVYSWIHIDDEVNAIRFLIHNDQAKGLFNLTSPNPLTNEEFGKTISKVMKRPHYFPLPAFMMQLLFGEVASMVLEGQRVLPKRLLEHGYIFKYPILKEALKDILDK